METLDYYAECFSEKKSLMKLDDLLDFKFLLQREESSQNAMLIQKIEDEIKRRATLSFVGQKAGYHKLRCIFEKNPELLSRQDIWTLREAVKTDIQKMEEENHPEIVTLLKDLYNEVNALYKRKQLA